MSLAFGASRNFGSIIIVVPSFLAGLYTATLTFETRANENHLSNEIQARITGRARAIGGTLQSATNSLTTQGFLQFAMVYGLHFPKQIAINLLYARNRLPTGNTRDLLYL